MSTEKTQKDRPPFEPANLSDYETVKSRLFMEVTSGSSRALEGVPFDRMEDMAVVYRIHIDMGDGRHSMIPVTTAMMDHFGVSHEQLREDALANAPALRPVVITGLTASLAAMPGAPPQSMGPEDLAEEVAFVATVPGGIRGAGVIAYPGFMEQTAEKLGGDFFILPSSIHEVLLVRDTGDLQAKALQNMVRQINAMEVAPEDRLTDSAYHYDSRDRVFELAEKFEARQAEKESEKIRDPGERSLISELHSREREVRETRTPDAAVRNSKAKEREAI